MRRSQDDPTAQVLRRVAEEVGQGRVELAQTLLWEAWRERLAAGDEVGAVLLLRSVDPDRIGPAVGALLAASEGARGALNDARAPLAALTQSRGTLRPFVRCVTCWQVVSAPVHRVPCGAFCGDCDGRCERCRGVRAGCAGLASPCAKTGCVFCGVHRETTASDHAPRLARVTTNSRAVTCAHCLAEAPDATSSRRIVFAACEGVLGDVRGPDPRCVARLHELCVTTGASVVPVGAQRWGGMGPVRRALLQAGLGATVRDVMLDAAPHRGRIIERWLQAHPEVRAWVALDAEPLAELPTASLVRTAGRELTEKDCARAREVLGALPTRVVVFVQRYGLFAAVGTLGKPSRTTCTVRLPRGDVRAGETVLAAARRVGLVALGVGAEDAGGIPLAARNVFEDGALVRAELVLLRPAPEAVLEPVAWRSREVLIAHRPLDVGLFATYDATIHARAVIEEISAV